MAAAAVEERERDKIKKPAAKTGSEFFLFHY